MSQRSINSLLTRWPAVALSVLLTCLAITHRAQQAVQSSFVETQVINNPLRSDQPVLPNRSVSLAQQFHDSDNLMTYIEQAMLEPETGGYYYALKAYDLCAREAKVAGHILYAEEFFTAEDHIPSAAQFTAAEHLARLCRGFIDTQTEPLSYAALLDEGLSLNDAKLRLSQQLEKISAVTEIEQNGLPTRAMLLKAVFASRDSWLMQDLAAELRLIQDKIHFIVNGERIANEENTALIDAIDALACELGTSCSSYHEKNRLLICAHTGQCAIEYHASDVAHTQIWRARLLKLILAGGELDYNVKHRNGQ